MSFSNAEVVKRWVEYNTGQVPPKRVRRDSAEGSSVKFIDKIFYSWRTPIARFTTDALKRQVILMCDTRYSTSTSTHQGMVEALGRAKFSGMFYAGHWIGVPGELNGLCPADFHMGNVQFAMGELMEIGKAIGANGHITENHWRYADDVWPREIEAAWNVIYRYALAFGRQKHMPPLAEIIGIVRGWREKRFNEWNDPKRKARREAYSARKNALKAFGLEEYREQTS